MQIIGKELYAKGTSAIRMFSAKDDLVYESNKLQTAQIQTTVNLGPIQGGIGNGTLLNIPDTPNLTLAMTASDFSLDAQGLQVGSTPHYNAIIPVKEPLTLSAQKTLTVTHAPVAPAGSSSGKRVAYVKGEAYEFGEDGSEKVIQLPMDTPAGDYCVEYYVQKLQSRQLDIKTLFAPAVVRALIETPLYRSDADLTNGSRVGTLYTTIPRLQLNGDINADYSQTVATTTVLNGTALSFDEMVATGANPCRSNEPKLAYMAIDLDGENTYDSVIHLAVIGGGIAGSQGDEVPLPIKIVMANGELQQIPAMSDFDVTVNPGTAGTYSTSTQKFTIGTTDGLITVATKSTLERPDLVTVIPVDEIN